MRVYIAGAYKAYVGHNEEIFNENDNVKVAAGYYRDILNERISAHCPFIATHQVCKSLDLNDEEWLSLDKEWLATADVLFMLPNWVFSAGARAEYNFAVARINSDSPIEIIEDDPDLIKLKAYVANEPAF